MRLIVVFNIDITLLYLEVNYPSFNSRFRNITFLLDCNVICVQGTFGCHAQNKDNLLSARRVIDEQSPIRKSTCGRFWFRQESHDKSFSNIFSVVAPKHRE